MVATSLERHRPLPSGRAALDAQRRQQQATALRPGYGLPDPAAAAKNLYLAVTAQVRSGDLARRGWHGLYDVMADVVATQHSFDGQRLCRAIAAALAEGRGLEAMKLCHELTVIARMPPISRWFGG